MVRQLRNSHTGVGRCKAPLTEANAPVVHENELNQAGQSEARKSWHRRLQAPPVLRRLGVFVAVGLISSIAYAATMALCIERFEWSILAAALAAFCTGTLVSYAGNSLLTFAQPMTPATFARFTVVVLLGLALNQAIAYSLDRLGAHYLLIAMAVFLIVPVANFIGHSLFTYRASRA
jgi:putative flippase GtrA